MSAAPIMRRRGTRLALRYLIAIILTLIFLFPIYWLFIISFKTPEEIFAFIAFLVIAILSVIVVWAIRRMGLAK